MKIMFIADPAPGAAKPPVDLGMLARGLAVLGHRHEIGDCHHAVVVGTERRLEDVGAREVALGGGPLPSGPDGPGSRPAPESSSEAKTLPLSKRGRQHQSMRTVETHQRGRAHVADEAIGGNRLLPSGAGAPSGGIGRRQEAGRRSSPNYKPARRILHRGANRPPSSTISTDIFMRTSLLLVATRSRGLPWEGPA